jgi:DNA-binding GntR family transcriptional regulator
LIRSPRDAEGAKRLNAERISTVDRVAQLLREMIADGRLSQGERLREIPLAESFAVARSTVRDAIRALAAEGVVVHELHRGAVVRTLTEADIADIYGVRRMLELRALEQVAAGDPAATERSEAALDACRDAVELGDYTTFVERELDFHAALVSHLGSPRIDQFFAQVTGELRLVFGLLAEDSEHGRSNAIAKRYRRIFQAARRGDVQTARKLLGDHLDAYEERLRAGLEQEAASTATG